MSTLHQFVIMSLQGFEETNQGEFDHYLSYTAISSIVSGGSGVGAPDGAPW